MINENDGNLPQGTCSPVGGRQANELANTIECVLNAITGLIEGVVGERRKALTQSGPWILARQRDI